MAYVDTQRRRNRPATVTVVTMLHLAVGYALVTGLAVKWTEKKEIITEGFPIPAPVPTETPKPKDAKAPERTPLDPPIDVYTPPIPMPQPTFTTDPGPMPTAEATQIAEVNFPTPTPTPTYVAPRFTPKPATPIGNPANWASASDYPQRDLREGNQGVTRFRLSVGVDGRVTGCTVTGSSGFPSLDAAACNKLTARGRFKAATGEDGEKIAGSYASSIKWQIPTD
jgi:periplasmic protein TonB